MRRLVKFTLLGIGAAWLWACGRDASPHDSLVVTDGRFDEWQAVPPIVDDPMDAPAEAAVDFGTVQVQDDSDFLHLTLETRRNVNAQAMRGTVHLVFDADDDESTGESVMGMTGVDAVLQLSRADTRDAGGQGAGVGVRLAGSEGLGEVSSAYAFGVLIAPTYSAPRFEIRIRRHNGRGGLHPFQHSSLRLRAVFDAGGLVLDSTAVVSYTFSTAPRNERGAPPAVAITKPPDAFRVVAWNVSDNNFRDRPAPFRRILAALEPDVIMLDEVYGAVGEGDLETFFGSDPLGTLGEWSFVLGRSGGRQKTVVASRLPIRPEESLLEVMYEAGALERLEREMPETPFVRYELERGRGVATTGAWVEVLGREVLFVPIDLQSAGYDGSTEDRLRELQAATLNRRVGSVLRATGDWAPVVIGGDLNLVGSMRPLEVMAAELDRGQALAVADAYRLTDRSQATWRNPQLEVFTPGRLDFVLYSRSSLEVVRSFAFDAAELTDAMVGDMGLERGDSEVTSDHLVVVADLRWKP